MMCFGRSGEFFMVLVFSFYLYASYRDQTQVVKLLWQTPLPVDPSS